MGESTDEEHEEDRAPDEDGDEPNQYGGGDTEIDPVEQTERVDADEDDESE